MHAASIPFASPWHSPYLTVGPIRGRFMHIKITTAVLKCDMMRVALSSLRFPPSALLWWPSFRRRRLGTWRVKKVSLPCQPPPLMCTDRTVEDQGLVENNIAFPTALKQPALKTPCVEINVQHWHGIRKDERKLGIKSYVCTIYRIVQSVVRLLDPLSRCPRLNCPVDTLESVTSHPCSFI